MCWSCCGASGTSAPPRPHRAWMLTRRDRADAIAEIRILVAHAEELADPTEFIDEF